MMHPPSEVLLCYHCGNRSVLSLVASHQGKSLFEHYYEERHDEAYQIHVYRCGTCEGFSIFGDFVNYPKHRTLKASRVFPIGSHLLPEAYKVTPSRCIPENVLKAYDEIWPLRHVSPGAFVAQVRRILEIICNDQRAEGHTLYEKLQHLVKRGTFPGYFSEMTNLMREVGNLGAHASAVEIDFWDAELLDEFFRAVVEYVYVAPAKIARLKERIAAPRHQAGS